MRHEEILQILTYDFLYEQYIEQLKTIDEIATECGVGHSTVSKYLDIYNIPIIKHGNRNLLKYSNITPTKIQKEVIDGALLGDGTICINKDNFTNGYFAYESISKQHVQYVYGFLSDFCLNEVKTSKNNSQKDIYRFTTKKYPFYSNIWKQWYTSKNGKYVKTLIPNDLKLTPLLCMIWYLGDGGLRTRRVNRNFPQQLLSLATNCFNIECVQDILIPQLSDFNARTEKTVNNGQYLITIPRNKITDFLEYIGDCPFDEYAYKWEYIPPIRNYADDKQIIELYNDGCAYTEMQEITGCGRTTLVTHIRKLKQDGILSGRN